MKKIFYWSPHISNVATIKNVINSAKSLKIYSKESLSISIINVIGEWEKFKEEFKLFNIDLIELSGLKLNKLFPVSGFIKSRLIYFFVLIFKYFSLKKILQNQKPDYLVLHLITSLPLILLVFYKFETKFILRISGLPKITILRKILWKLVSKKIYLITCPSHQTKKDLLELGIFSEKKLKIVHDPILQVNEINNNLKKISEKNIKAKTYLLNIGRLTKQKNQILLLKAFSEIIKNYQDLSLIIIGEGEERKNLERFIKVNNLSNNVFLIGHINNVYPIIKNCLAFISTSLWEDPGAAMIEASFCNKSIISSNCRNGPEEFLSFGRDGYLFENNDKKSLLNKIDLFLKDSENKRIRKVIECKKKTRNYTIFNHYKVFSLFLDFK